VLPVPLKGKMAHLGEDSSDRMGGAAAPPHRFSSLLAEQFQKNLTKRLRCAQTCYVDEV
jgi:hypothetical protein